ncbi:MAG: L,D-transpeptidase family protein [Anaerolineae bacterium]
MNDFNTVPNPTLQPARPNNKSPRRGVPQHNLPQRQPSRLSPARRVKKRSSRLWLLLIPVSLLVLCIVVLVTSVLLVQLSFANKILPRVAVANIEVGNMTRTEATAYLMQQWQTITLRDGERTWSADVSALGLTLDAHQSAERAFAQGHGEGGWRAHISEVNVAPIYAVDVNALDTYLSNRAFEINQAPQNAGIAIVDSELQTTAPVDGYMLDVQATINQLQSDPALLADGILELVMVRVTPAVTDASPLLVEAEVMLSSPLDIRVFDPVTGNSAYWSLMSEVWRDWVTAVPAPERRFSLALSLDRDALRAYLQQQVASTFDATRSIDYDATITRIQNALSAGSLGDIYTVVQHQTRTHTVQSGESITSIAWDYGIPYPYIMQANGGLESVSIGQTITIPPADYFIEGEVNPNKRIVVSISRQRTYVYENDQLLYEWVSSTGINTSPTWTGVYQILSHEPNAYAANWNLYMPNFMGVYRPVPGADFTNGFHGFPTRGGGQLLWENNLGQRVTYGCILLSNTHIAILYEWAEEGVIVEIQA